MTSAEQPPRRGRPPGPSLSHQAVCILERNALSALRGPTSRGAVPRTAFDGVDASTVDRSVKREFGGASGRTPFDLASHQVCSLEGGTRQTLQAVFEAVAQSFRDTDEMHVTLRVFLRANFTEACVEEGLLASILIQVAACAHVEANGSDGSEQTVAALEIIEMRRRQYDEMTDGFAAGLAIALRRLGRRPKSGLSIRDIVVAVIATSDGFLTRHRLQPDLFDADLVVETQWNVIWTMSEPGLLHPPDRANPEEHDLVQAALAVYSAGRAPAIDDLAREAGVSVAVASALFPSDFALAQRCMDYSVGSSVETQAIAVGVRGAELAAIRDVLIATTQQAEATPQLIEVVRSGEGGFCAELRRHISEALGQSEAVRLTSDATDGVALMLVDAALQGRSGQAIWESGLLAFTAEG